MSLSDIFSKRRKRERGEMPDVYQYEEIPAALRVQVLHIVRDSLGQVIHNPELIFDPILNTLCREYGVFRLTEDRGSFNQLTRFFLDTSEIEKALDFIELTFLQLPKLLESHGPYIYASAALTIPAAIEELNIRFREHGVGYQFEAGQLIRIDRTLIHAEVVKPALSLLSEKQYKGANEEFMSAHAHYRSGRYDETLVDCVKAIESVLKIICKKQGWRCASTDTAKRLLEIVFEKELIPSFMQSHFTALRSTLESGMPTLRNKLGGHGQGDETRTVETYIASYALHVTASNLVLLIEAEKALH